MSAAFFAVSTSHNFLWTLIITGYTSGKVVTVIKRWKSAKKYNRFRLSVSTGCLFVCLSSFYGLRVPLIQVSSMPVHWSGNVLQKLREVPAHNLLQATLHLTLSLETHPQHDPRWIFYNQSSSSKSVLTSLDFIAIRLLVFHCISLKLYCWRQFFLLVGGEQM